MSSSTKRGSAGGKAMALKQRMIAIDNYYTNPIICKECNSIIEIHAHDKVSTVRRKSFCNKTCTSTYRNKHRPTSKYKRRDGVIPLAEYIDSISVLNKSKSELFSSRSTYQSARSAIQKLARTIYYSECSHQHCCRIGCAYDTHIDVAHIIPVSEFSDTTLISTINDKSNLMGLCKNHHWEFDNNIITLADIELPYNNY